MERWVLGLGRLGSLRLHHWFRSDDKRFKHDHPADFITLVLRGGYEDLGQHTCAAPIFTDADGFLRCAKCYESVTPDGSSTVEQMPAGSLRRRHAEHQHTVAVRPGGCWTLCFFFADRRDWGFWVPRKLDGKLKWTKSNKFFIEQGHHPCDQP